MTGIKRINLISAVLVSLSLCGGCTLEKAGNSSQDQTVQEDNETEQIKTEKAEKEELNDIHLRDKDSLYVPYGIEGKLSRKYISYMERNQQLFCLLLRRYGSGEIPGGRTSAGGG